MLKQTWCSLYTKKLALFSALLFSIRKEFFFSGPKTFLPCNILLLVSFCYGRYFPLNENTDDICWNLLSCLNMELHYKIVYFILNYFMSYLIIVFNACVKTVLPKTEMQFLYWQSCVRLLMYCHNREKSISKLYLIKPLYLFEYPPFFLNWIFCWNSVSNNFHNLWEYF